LFEKRNADADLIDNPRGLKARVHIILFQEFAEGTLADWAERSTILDELSKPLQ
jgi:hypothetical protein